MKTLILRTLLIAGLLGVIWVSPTQTATKATQTPNRYPSPDSKGTPVCAAVRAATERSEANRVADLLAAGIDPVSGNRIAQSTVVTNPQPPMAAAPPHTPIFVQQLTIEQQRQVIELAATGVPLAEAKRRVVGEGKG